MENARKLPTCIGFIMDGNRRWAESRGVSSLLGHHEGHETFRRVVDWVSARRIPHMVVYAFSTENWNRSQHEVEYLMELLTEALKRFQNDLIERKRTINVRIVGDRSRLPERLKEEIVRAESRTFADPELTVWIALAYGGRAEIIAAINSAISQGTSVYEETFAEHLWTQGMPDPDLIVRTGGERRLSNFLLWQSAYSELFFTDTLWPDFGETEFQGIVDAYGERKRRYGK